MARPFQLVAAGIAMVGTAFGLARYGYGLLLPEIRSDFGLSSASLGLIATGSYVAYLVTTAAMAGFGDRVAPQRPVVLGGLAAIAGMVLIACARSSWLLAAGVMVAGASAALAYPPFSTAVARSLPPERRGRALAMISSGTGWGVAIAVPIALLAGTAWRGAWVAFAAIAALSTLLAARVLRPARLRSEAPGAAQALPPLSWSWFVCPRSGPLLAGALLVGVGASVYWTFAADFATSGSGHSAAGPVLLGVVGVSSILGSGAGDMLERIGGRRALVVSAGALAASMCVLALWNASWVGIVLSAAAFGSTYNLLLAVQVIWSARVFAQRPATGLAAMLFMLAIGQVAGPALAGALADRVGLAAAFFAGGAVIGLAALLPPREELRASPGRAPVRG
jgi:predicted MFS family arabinose efflux permease